MITLLVMTDGRPYIEETLASFEAMVTGTVTRRVIHDDSGDLENHRRMCERFGPEYEIHAVFGGRRGYSQAIQHAWKVLSEDTNRFTFHLEDDFVFNRPVNLDELAEFLDEKWWLAQIALRRERWGREERGFVEDMPSAYQYCFQGGLSWIEHTLYYTMTPHLYRSELRDVGWPDGIGSEVTFKDKLLRDGLPWGVPGDHVRMGFWGGIEDGANAVKHIGEVRAGHGY